jgi:hypothetical protein
MSISAMTNVAFLRRADVPPLGVAAKSDAAIAQATGGTDASRASGSQMQVIATYIPTEVLTLYVATVAVLHDSSKPILLSPKARMTAWITFGVFVVGTPVIVWLSYAGKVHTAVQQLPLAPRTWPFWEMFAATVAYIAWAFALPNSPFESFENWYSSALAGVVVLTTTTILGLLAPVLQRPLPT